MTVRLALFGSLLVAAAAAGLLLLRSPHAASSGQAGRISPRTATPAPAPSEPHEWAHLAPESLRLRSAYALVLDQGSDRVLYAKAPQAITPIASITKLMSAMVLLDARLPMDVPVTVTDDDVDVLRGSLSKLPVGWTLTRADLLHLALMASENRAAHALARTYPGGVDAFVAAMNAKARELGMAATHYADPTGLNNENVSTARDLAALVKAAYGYETIRRMTTSDRYEVRSLSSGRARLFGNSNGLVRDPQWTIGLSKTGFINDSGFCLVMQTIIHNRPVILVLLDSVGKLSRIGDAERIRRWLESGPELALYVRRHASGHAGA